MPPLPAIFRVFARPIPLALLLALGTAIPVLVAAALVVQILVDAVPTGSMRLMVAPGALFLHALAGTLFGVAGPLQFLRALKRRFGRLHRIIGWIFVGAGLVLGASALGLLHKVSASPLLDATRTLAGAALIGALVLGLTTRRHRAWMIRAYAIGMGSGTVALVFFPIFALTGSPPTGLVADLIMVGCWAVTVLLAEFLIRTLEAPR